MNRRKKIINKLTKKHKQAQAKKQLQKKPPYISKADREKAELPAKQDMQAEEA